MYSDKASSYCEALHAEGRRVFESFKHSVTLQTVFCQIGENIEQITFREALLRLCTYSTIPEDYDLFATQFWDILPPELNLMMFSIFCQHVLLFWSSTVVD